MIQKIVTENIDRGNYEIPVKERWKYYPDRERIDFKASTTAGAHLVLEKQEDISWEDVPDDILKAFAEKMDYFNTGLKSAMEKQ